MTKGTANTLEGRGPGGIDPAAVCDVKKAWVSARNRSPRKNAPSAGSSSLSESCLGWWEAGSPVEHTPNACSWFGTERYRQSMKWLKPLKCGPTSLARTAWFSVRSRNLVPFGSIFFYRPLRGMQPAALFRLRHKPPQTCPWRSRRSKPGFPETQQQGHLWGCYMRIFFRLHFC